MTGAPSHRRGVLLVLGAALIWSTGGVAIKAVTDSALKVAFYRSAFAALALWIMLRPRPRRLTPAFAAGLVSYAACLTTFVVATKWTTAANAIFLQYSGVVWVLLFSPLVVGEPLHLRDIAAVVAAFGGMALFFVGKLRAGGAGDGIALLSGVFFAGLVLSLRRERHAGAEAAVTYGNVLAAAALLPFVARDLSLTPRSLAILAFLGVVQIGVSYVLFVRGLESVPATQASLIGMAEPVLNPIWVFLILGERPSPFAVLGGAIVLGAIGWRTLTAPALEKVAPPD
ncbi:MAG TPA: DMT family transporter [Thermoanaerobaculia bacterium]|nr:DMT family transporter [Thermoanaerobaculia bacterium]